MLKNIRALLVVCSVVVLAACGGGGGSSDSTPSFAGRYHEVASVTTNSCNLAGLATLDGFDVVTQGDRTVTIVSGDITLTGTVDADNGGFTVNGSQVSSGVTIQATGKYRTISTGNMAMEMKMIANGTCTIIYTGTATKI